MDVLADAIYLDLKDDNSSTGNLPIIGQVNVHSEVDLKAWIVTPMVSYTVLEKDKFTLDILAGVRYLWLDLDVQMNVGNDNRSASDSGHTFDGIVGIRGEVTLNEKWYLPYHLDIGTGDSEVTYQAFGGVGYRFSKVDLVAVYRYLRWNFDDNPVVDNLYVLGPLVGIKFRF